MTSQGIANGLARTWERLRGWLRPPRQLRTTTLGKLTIAMTIVVGVAAMNTGNNLLYLVLGGLFGLISASGVLSEQVLKELGVAIEVPEVVLAGRTTAVKLRVRSGRRPLFLVDFHLLDDAGRVIAVGRLEELAPHRATLVVLRWHPDRRGAVRWNHVRAGTRFPFQMYEKRRRYPCGRTVWVAPEPAGRARLPTGGLARADGERGSGRRREGDTYEGLRSWSRTDAPSRIHWKRTATTGELVVKRFVEPPGPKPIVRLGRGPDPKAFEEGLRIASALVEHTGQHHRGLVLVAGDRSLEVTPERRGRAWLLLAMLERDELPEGPAVEIAG